MVAVALDTDLTANQFGDPGRGPQIGPIAQMLAPP